MHVSIIVANKRCTPFQLYGTFFPPIIRPKCLQKEIQWPLNALLRLMRPLHAEVKKEMIDELRNQEIDREKLDLMYSNAKLRFDEMYDLLVSRFLEFHKTLTSEQKEKLVAEMEKHHERRRRFHPRWKDES